MSPKKEMQTHLGRETGRDSLRPSGPIRNLLSSAVWSSKYQANEQASSRFGCLRKPNRTPQLQDKPENAQRSSANVEILSKYLIQIEDSFMAQLLSGKLERTH